jgi:ribosomal protein S18 acetylase RimI-like enzyme
MERRVESPSEEGGLIVVRAGEEHLPGLMECHLAVFTGLGNVMTALGSRVLESHCRFYMREPGGVCLVSVDRATRRVSGFVLGGSPHLRRRFLARHFLLLSGNVALRLFTNPYLRARVARCVRSGLRSVLGRLTGRRAELKVAEFPEPKGNWAVLFMIGTHPDFRRRGIGKALVQGFAQECAVLGFETIRVVARTKNVAACELYRGIGWLPVATVDNLRYFERTLPAGRRLQEKEERVR